MAKDKKLNVGNNPLLEETLKENEAKANKLCCRISIVIVIICIVSEILDLMGVFQLNTTVASASNLAALILLVPILMNKSGKFSSGVMKKIILICIFVTMIILDAVYNYNVAVVIAVPIVFAAMYFDVRTVVFTSVATVVFYGIETYLSALLLIHIDNNHVDPPAGTVVNVETELKDALLEGIDPAQYAMNSMVLGYLPRILQVLAFVAASIAIAKYGQAMLLRQANVTAEQTRISTELAVANRLQFNVLPEAEELNGKYGFQIAASMTAARETGGDFYDFEMLDDDHLAIAIADVSDKGVPAAMFMMAAKTILCNNYNVDRSPAQIIKDTNERLCTRNKEGMFVTVWLGIYEISSGTLTCTNAGHEDPIKYTAGKGYDEIRFEHGTLVGVFEDMEYQDNVIELKAGDALILYTDGIADASNSSKEMYGVERLIAGLNRNCADDAMTASEIMEAIKVDVADFVDGAEQFDDMTMVILKI